MSVLILNADARQIPLADKSVHCCVTSPPYWGLRDYGVAGQLGLEKTPEEYIAQMVQVFREVKRVLRDDGTCWINMGDSYQGGNRGEYGKTRGGNGIQQTNPGSDTIGAPNRFPVPGLKAKDLVGVPWMLAFALRADGWYLRSDIIWSKPNPMPESVTDRPTKAHEYIFLLSKSERYYYDAGAIAEKSISGDPRKPYGPGQVDARGNGHDRGGGTLRKPTGWDTEQRAHGTIHKNGRRKQDQVGNRRYTGFNERWDVAEELEIVGETRNRRTVWQVPGQPFPEAHFATFPEELIKPCILAGCPQGGTVFDPFMGSGTTLLVARNLQCNAIGLELNAAYIEIAKRRLAQEVLEFK